MTGLSIGVSFGAAGMFAGDSIAILFAGLSGGIARIGTHGTLTIIASEGPITARKWGSASGGSQYGTDTTPTDFEGSDGAMLYATATVNGQEHQISAPVRYAAPIAAMEIYDAIVVTATAITPLNVAANFTVPGDDDLSGMTFSLAPSSAALPAGLNLSANGQITGMPTTETEEVDIVVRGTNSGGYADTGFGITVSAAVFPATVNSVTAGAWTGSTRTIAVDTSGAQIGDTLHWVVYTDGDAEPTNVDVAAGKASGSGEPVTYGSDTITAIPHTLNITLSNGIVRGDYVLAVVIDNGALSNVDSTVPFEIDTTNPILSEESFADDAAEGIAWAFRPDENIEYRISLWADGTNPGHADIASGSGAEATVTGSASGTASATGTFVGVGAGTWQPTAYYADEYGNAHFETYADVTVTAAASEDVLIDFSTAPAANTGFTGPGTYDAPSKTRTLTGANASSDANAYCSWPVSVENGKTYRFYGTFNAPGSNPRRGRIGTNTSLSAGLVYDELFVSASNFAFDSGEILWSAGTGTAYIGFRPYLLAGANSLVEIMDCKFVEVL